MLDPDDEDLDDNLPLRELARLRGGTCQDCSQQFSDAEALYSIALGFKNAPRCMSCLCRRLQRDPADLQSQLQQYIFKRDCYLRAWQSITPEQVPANAPEPTLERLPADSSDLPPEVAATWDAGDLGCGELVMELRIRLKKLPAGSVYHLFARDPAAPEDIPAWCRLCGHTLLKYHHPQYWIQKSGA